MNHRHIQTFLTVSAAFFALNAPLQAHASSESTANANAAVCAAQCSRADVNAATASKAERQPS